MYTYGRAASALQHCLPGAAVLCASAVSSAACRTEPCACDDQAWVSQVGLRCRQMALHCLTPARVHAVISLCVGWVGGVKAAVCLH